jgi:dihydrodipicolinate synthase/N-acetylneuraminate lyase
MTKFGDNPWRGAFPIPMTPYDENDEIDQDVLAGEVEFCVECGVGGIATPLMVSEFRGLSEDERKLMIRVPVEVVAGRIPLVANCAAVSTRLAVEYAEYAASVGADAVVAMPPYIHRHDFESIMHYYQSISDAVDIPVWIQNAGVSPLSGDQIVKLCTEIANVSWVKEEVPPSHRNIGALVERSSSSIDGVMGGGAGRPMMMEHARGSRGVIHACQFCDLVQKTWELLDAGEIEAAGDLHEILLPGLFTEGLLGMAFAKEIMVRRGVFKNHRMRGQSEPLDALDMVEIDRIWNRIEPHLIWRK